MSLKEDQVFRRVDPDIGSVLIFAYVLVSYSLVKTFAVNTVDI